MSLAISTERLGRSGSQSPLRILVIRGDRLGDVILSTPVFETLKKYYPESRLTVMVRDAVAPVVRGLSSVDEVLIYDPEGRHSGLRGFLTLVREIKAGNHRIAIVLQSNLWIGLATLFARIRYRIGPLSKPHSYFCYNRGVRQKRSEVEMHEADYNLQLLRRLGIRVPSRKMPTRVAVSDAAKEKARLWLVEHGWKNEHPLVLVHPGMSGSALNWPEPHYIEFIRGLLKDERQVLVTGGPAEVSLVQRIREALGPAAKDQVIFYSNQEPMGGVGATLEFFAGLISHSSLAVAPSTGPLHLAVALEKPVLTFYPPIRVQSAIRWGPYIKDETRAAVMVPEVYCGQDFKCLGNLCNYFPCMKSLTVNQALQEAHRLLAGEETVV